MTVPGEKTVAGWKEWVSLPELGVERISAKLDTGAKSSAIHARDIIEFEKRGAPWVEFVLCADPNPKNEGFHCTAPVVDKRAIRSSSGHVEDRYVVRTFVKLGRETWPIELTLANREEMEFRLLLGRDALAGKVVIDPDTVCLSGKR